MKTKTQTSPKGSAARATKQAPTQTAPLPNVARAGNPEPLGAECHPELHRLVLGGKDSTETLVTDPDGVLYLWTGEVSDGPRKVNFDEARTWWQKFKAHKPELDNPLFDVTTDAGRFVNLLNERLRVLVNGNDLTEDCLWASPGGRLYLWTGALSESPVGIDFVEARDWWQKYQAHAPYLAAPQFDEHSAAGRIVRMVCEAMRAKDSKETAANPQPVAREAATVAGAVLPFVIAGEFTDAVSILRENMQAACALNLMAMDVMAHDMKVNSGWEQFAFEGFEDGAYELARSVFVNLAATLDDYKKAHQPAIDRCLASRVPVVPVTRSNEAILAAHNSSGGDVCFELGIQLEHSVQAVRQLISLQAAVMGERKVEGWHAAEFVCDGLWRGFNEVFRAGHKLRKTFNAVELAAAEPQRQAA